MPSADREFELYSGVNQTPPIAPADVAYVWIESSPDPCATGQVFALEHEQVWVGALGCNHVSVSRIGAPISRVNTSFDFAGGRYWVRDMHSTFGTKLNGVPVGSGRCALGIGDVIDLGGELDESGMLRGSARLVFLGTARDPRSIRRADQSPPSFAPVSGQERCSS